VSILSAGTIGRCPALNRRSVEATMRGYLTKFAAFVGVTSSFLMILVIAFA